MFSRKYGLIPRLERTSTFKPWKNPAKSSFQIQKLEHTHAAGQIVIDHQVHVAIRIDGDLSWH